MPRPTPNPPTRPRARALAALLLAGLMALSVAPAAAQTEGKDVVWGQNVFVIPYRWSGHSDRSAAKEVVLYSSTDQGVSWNEVTRARPDVQSFMYRAPSDGEYCFAIRTIDRTGGTWPSGPMTAELRVVVDTVLPKVRFQSAQIGHGSRLTVEAILDDPQLDAATISVAYQHPTTGAWTAMTPSVSPGLGSQSTVRASATLPPGAANVRVQVRVKDRAGNPASAGVIATGAAGDWRGAYSPPTNPGPYAPPQAPSRLPYDPFHNNTAAGSLAQNGWQANPYVAQPRPTTSESWPADNLRRPSVAMPPGPTTPIAADSPETFRFASNSPTAGLPLAGASGAGPRTLLVSSHRFELEYQLQTVGEWGVSRVEIWGTENGGRSWRQFAIDTDQRSPVNLQTPGEGLFGFVVVVQSVGGLQRRPPEPGDKPDVQVLVDQTRPQVELAEAVQPEGYFADHLMFSWQAQDANLASKPVSLHYAAQPSGPWLPIATNLENTGRYSWRLKRHLPSSIYVRLEARDRAGNVGVDQSPTPLTLRMVESSGRIQGVRALE